MATYTIAFDGRPALDNELVGVHWGVKARRKARDARLVAEAAALAGVPAVALPRAVVAAARAAGLGDVATAHAALVTPRRRRVAIRVEGPFRSKLPDPFACHKSLCDALTNAGLLVDDDARWCECGPAEFARAASYKTTITLTDLED